MPVIDVCFRKETEEVNNWPSSSNGTPFRRSVIKEKADSIAIRGIIVWMKS